VRPLVRRIIAPIETSPAALPAGGGFGGGFGVPLGEGLPGEAAVAAAATVTVDNGEPLKVEVSKTSKMIDLAQVQGQVHAQSVQKVGDIADKNPRETVSIIRQWLQENAAA
jgi:flagellar M-ring protein FliF